MNEGNRRRVISVPWIAPNTAQKSRPARIAAHHGQCVVTGCTSWTVIAAPQAPTNPTDRSISPSTRANPSPMARTITTALCWNRFTRLTGETNTWFGLQIVNTTRMATIAAMTGRTPLSPDLTREIDARTYPPERLRDQRRRHLLLRDLGGRRQVRRFRDVRSRWVCHCCGSILLSSCTPLPTAG